MVSLEKPKKIELKGCRAAAPRISPSKLFPVPVPPFFFFLLFSHEELQIRRINYLSASLNPLLS